MSKLSSNFTQLMAAVDTMLSRAAASLEPGVPQARRNELRDAINEYLGRKQATPKDEGEGGLPDLFRGDADTQDQP